MASRQSTVNFLVGQMGTPGTVSAKKMFGEYGVFFSGKMVALVCDDKLFVKPTKAGQAFLGEAEEAAPYPGAKPCFAIPEDKWEDREWLSRLVALTATELPAPKKK